MEITTDVLLRGTEWDRAISSLGEIFKTRTNYSIYMLCVAIGIMYDKRIEKPEENNDNGKLDFIFQAAILSTKTEDFSEEERLNLAFGEKSDFNRMAFITQFANFGVTKLTELIGASTIESMENIKNFFSSTVEGRNFDIDTLPDDILLSE